MSTFVFSSKHKDAEYRSLVVGMIDSDEGGVMLMSRVICQTNWNTSVYVVFLNRDFFVSVLWYFGSGVSAVVRSSRTYL